MKTKLDRGSINTISFCFWRNRSEKQNKIYINHKTNINQKAKNSTKRHLRADGLSLLPSALRPRLVGDSGVKSTSFSLVAVVVLSLAFSFFLQTSYALNTSAASLTITIPSNPLSLDLNPSSNNGFSSTSSSFNVKTDNSSGYTVSIKSKNDSGNNSLVNASSTGTGSSSSNNNKLTSITEAISEDTFKNSSKYLNMWGWLPSKLNNETNTNYQIAPGIEEVILESTEEANNETGVDYNISLAAKVDSSAPAGTYSNTFVISAVSNEVPQKEYEPVECSRLEVGQTGTMTDPRDGETYTIARLKDGKCWMTQNLRITGSSTFQYGHSATLTSDDSDLPVGTTYTLPTSVIWSEKDAIADSDHAYYDNDTNYGAWYTWYTATANTGDASMTTQGQNASSSICPKGWRLPTGGDDGEFQALINASGISNDSTGSTNLRSSPLSFVYAGDIEYLYGRQYFQGSEGYYWSSTAYDDKGAYGLSLYNSGINTAYHSYRPNGLSVRCVARGERPKNIGTMQTVDQWGDSVKKGDIVLATDSRDNSIYTVSRLKDGKLWMTQNLRIGGDKTITLTPETTAIKENYELPESDINNFRGVSVDISALYIDENNDGYYSWKVANAGGNTYLSDGITSSASICPKGWHLPSKNEFNALQVSYTPASLYEEPANFSNSGIITNWNHNSYGSGYYITSSRKNTSNYYSLIFSRMQKIFNSKFSNLNISYGALVRCMSGDSSLSQYEITYKSIEGDNIPSPQKGETATFVTLNNDIPKREGYSFVAWCSAYTIDRSCSGTTYVPGETYSPADNPYPTFYAIWEKIPAECAAISSIGQTSTMKDNRDGNTYTIARLADGKCWMTQNLKLGDKQPMLLTPEDSDVPSNFTLPASVETLDSPQVYYVPVIYDRNDSYGSLYNWLASVAISGESEAIFVHDGYYDYPQSICPKGWYLPTGMDNSDFTGLTSKYTTLSQLISRPPNFTLGGRVDDWTKLNIIEVGTRGKYWGSTGTQYNSSYLDLYQDLNKFESRSGTNSVSGSIRCVGRE